MKKIFSLFIIASMFICVSSAVSQAAVEIVTTTTDLKAIVDEVGGGLVKVTSLGRGHEDPHFIEPRPQFMLTLKRARAVFLVGMDLEIWLKPLLEGSRNLLIQRGSRGYVDCSQVINAKEIPQTRVDPSMGDVHPLGNPHYWLDPYNAIKIAELAADKLSEIEPAHKEVFHKNCENFKSSLLNSIAVWKEKLSSIAAKKIACFHSSWIYFTDFAGLEIVGYVESRPGIPPVGREIAALVEVLKANDVKLILREKYHTDRFADLAASKSGSRVLVLPASVGAVKGTETYEKLMDYIVNAIVSEMNK